MACIVVYESHYGHTERYARWLAEDLGCRALPRRQVRPADLAGCDTVLYGGGLYAGGVAGARFLDGRLLGKRLALFTCGLADPANPENAAALARAAERALPPPLRATAAVFHLQGGIDYPRLRRTHRAMMAMLRATLANRDPASLREEDRELLRTYGQVVDFTDRAALAPLLAWARGERDAAPAGPD